MAHERTQPPWRLPSPVPAGLDRQSLLDRDGPDLETQYRRLLKTLGKQTGMLTYEELLQRDKVSLDLFWLRDDSLEDGASLPEPDVLATEIAEDLRAALEQFALIAEDLGEEEGERP